MLLIVAKAMSEVRQPVMIPDQFPMKFDGGFNHLAAFPMVFAEPGLNAELTLDQVLPRMAFLIHFVMNMQAPIV